jgi:hypothetical protein
VLPIFNSSFIIHPSSFPTDGAPVILVQGDKLAKLERYELLDPECDSPQLEAMLLEAVRGSHAPYSRKELEAVLAKVTADALHLGQPLGAYGSE